MIMIEHFSKWVELVVLPDKSSHNTSQVFLRTGPQAYGLTERHGSDMQKGTSEYLLH
jgi:hypothetical protein